MALKRFSLIRGDSETYSLAFTQGTSGSAYCLKNCVIKYTLKKHYDLTDAQASLQKIITTFSDTTAGTNGSATISLLPADTASLDVGEYDFDIVLTTASNENYTVIRGKLDLEYDVTRDAGTAGTGA